MDIAPPGTESAESEPPRVRTGRNLPVAIGVGAGLGGLVILTLFTVKATFLLYMGIAVAVALAELTGAFAKRDIQIPVIPVAAGGAATLTCMYWLGYKAALAATALTVVVIFAWRLPGGTTGYVKDTTAGVFAFAYLPFLASFVAAMLVPADGGRRVLTFVIVTICSDIGGYFAGITVGRHPMAPGHQPQEDLGGLRRLRRRVPGRRRAVPDAAAARPRLAGPAHRGRGGARGDPRRPGRIHDQARPGHQGHGHGAARSRRHPGPARLPARLRPRGVAAAGTFVRV